MCIYTILFTNFKFYELAQLQLFSALSKEQQHNGKDVSYSECCIHYISFILHDVCELKRIF